MKRLENIPKQNIFEVPEGYFDKLPGIIQARVTKEAPASKWSPVLRYSLQYALPVLLLGVVAVFWLNQYSQPRNAEEMLAKIETSYLEEYLDESALVDDYAPAMNELTETDVDEIEGAVYFNLDDQGEADDFYNQLEEEYTNEE